jgi:hypothetical protein
MFQSITDIWRRQRDSVDSHDNRLPLILEMSGATEGTVVPANTVVNALLWQHYGLDLLHPEVSRWLEKNAPDVKYAVARNRFAKGDDCNGENFRVGRNGTLKIYLSLEIDDRLRKVSSEYIWWQVQRSIEPEKEGTGGMKKLLNNYAGSKSENGCFAYQH